MSDIKITVALVSGLFALLGGFLGAWLTRRTEYEKWIRQQRSNEYTEFIRQLEKLRSKARLIIYDSEVDNQAKDIQITELFSELKPQENIVRLYLDGSDRDKFSKLLHAHWSYYSPTVEQSLRMKKEEELMQSIQSLFENTIKG